MTYTVPVGLPNPEPYLLPEEALRFVVRRHHPIVLLPAAVIATAVLVAVLVAAGNTAVTPGTAMAAVFIVGAALLYLAYRWLHWQRTVLVVTNRRLFQLVSLGVQRVTVMPVVRQSIVFRQGPVGRWLGFATVEVQSATGSVLYEFRLLGRPTEFRDRVTDIAA